MTRYKVKVEHDGAWPAAADGDPGHLVPEAPETDNNDRDSTTATSINKGKRMPFTPTTSAAGKQAEGAAGEAEGGGAAAAAAAAAAEAEVGNPSGFANPTLAQLVLVPAREASAQIATPAVEGGGPPGQQGRQRRTLVTVRGLKPRERYRVLVRGGLVGERLVQRQGEGGLSLPRCGIHSRGLSLGGAVTTRL